MAEVDAEEIKRIRNECAGEIARRQPEMEGMDDGN